LNTSVVEVGEGGVPGEAGCGGSDWAVVVVVHDGLGTQLPLTMTVARGRDVGGRAVTEGRIGRTARGGWHGLFDIDFGVGGWGGRGAAFGRRVVDHPSVLVIVWAHGGLEPTWGTKSTMMGS
jgi:hypothetical protein